LALGSWLLALGSWLLALGSWLLALGKAKPYPARMQEKFLKLRFKKFTRVHSGLNWFLNFNLPIYQLTIYPFLIHSAFDLDSLEASS
jgi:hypothetical protein